MTRIVFDSHALLTFFQNEKGADKVEKTIRTVNKDGGRKLIHIINLAEILYITKRTFGEAEKIQVYAAIKRMDFEIVQATEDLVFFASDLKAEYSISFADCFALATAITNDAKIITGDPEFKEVAHLVDVVWI